MKSKINLEFENFFMDFNNFLKSNYQKVLDYSINNQLSNKFTIKPFEINNQIIWFEILHEKHLLIHLSNDLKKLKPDCNIENYITFYINSYKYCFDLLNELNINYIEFIENWFNNKIHIINEIINYIKQNVNKESKGFCFSIFTSNISIKIHNYDSGNTLLIDNNKYYIKNMFYTEHYLYIFEINNNKIILNIDNIANLFNGISVLDTVLYHINNKENDILVNINKEGIIIKNYHLNSNIKKIKSKKYLKSIN